MLDQARTEQLLTHLALLDTIDFDGKTREQAVFNKRELESLLHGNLKLLELTKVPVKSQSNIRDHAERELELLVNQPSATEGPDDVMDEYEARVHQGVMELLEVFINQHHSGMSAQWTLALFRDLANFKALTPLTDNPAEWNEVGEGTWQSTRQSSCFSRDGGATHYDINEKPSWWGRLIPRKLMMKMSPDLRIRAMYKVKKTQASPISWIRRSS